MILITTPNSKNIIATLRIFIIEKSESEAATRDVLEKKVLEISQNSQQNTCVRVSFLIKLQALAQLFCCEFCEISNNTFLKEHLWTTALVWVDIPPYITFPWESKRVSYLIWFRVSISKSMFSVSISIFVLQKQPPEVFYKNKCS